MTDPTMPDDPFVTIAHDRACAALVLHDDPGDRYAMLSVPEGVPVEWWLAALADCPDNRPVTLMGHPARGELDVWDDADTAQAYPPLAWWLAALAALPAGTLVDVATLPDFVLDVTW